VAEKAGATRVTLASLASISASVLASRVALVGPGPGWRLPARHAPARRTSHRRCRGMRLRRCRPWRCARPAGGTPFPGDAAASRFPRSALRWSPGRAPAPAPAASGRRRSCPSAVFAADRLEGAAAGRHGIQLFVERSLEPAITHGQRIQARLGHRTASQGVDDLGSALRTDHLLVLIVNLTPNRQKRATEIGPNAGCIVDDHFGTDTFLIHVASSQCHCQANTAPEGSRSLNSLGSSSNALAVCMTATTCFRSR
jgi:hypothetical protein